MSGVLIYLAGAMGGLVWEEQIRWREKIRDAILYGEYDIVKKVEFFNPPTYYNFEEPSHKTEKEVMEFDLYNLRRSDFVIVNFNDGGNSLGTAMELMLAKELKKPVIGLNANNISLHPWLIECTTRMCDDIQELVEYVVQFYLS